MSFCQHIFSQVLKCLNVHKGWRIHHAHFAVFPSQLTTSFDKASIEVGIELQRLFIVLLYKLFQLSSKVAAVSIRRIRYHHIIFVGNDIVSLCQRIGIVAKLTQFVHLLPQLIHELLLKGEHILHLFLCKEVVV